MKRINLRTALALTVFFLVFTGTVLKAQGPSPATWLRQTDCIYDSTNKIFTIVLEWQNGLVDYDHPEAEGYNVYRSLVGHDKEVEDYELVGTAKYGDAIDGVFIFNDDIEVWGCYYYYVKGYRNNVEGAVSPITIACAPTGYCINLKAEIIDFVSFPETIAIAGETYEYQAYAKHRSFRVQGWVRYHLVEGPEGMEIDEKSGFLEWLPPADASGEYYVKIRATSDEDANAESVQEWYIRIATSEELQIDFSSVNYEILSDHLLIYPNPVKDRINIDYNALGNKIRIDLITTDGKILCSKKLDLVPGENLLNLPVDVQAAGTYFIKITDKDKISFGRLIITQ